MSHDKADFDHTMPPQPVAKPVAKPPAKLVDVFAGKGSLADKLRQRREEMEEFPAGKPK